MTGASQITTSESLDVYFSAFSALESSRPVVAPWLHKIRHAAMKRFAKTGTGKLKRWHANHSHILTKKTRKRKNRLKKADYVSSADFPRVSRLLQA